MLFERKIPDNILRLSLELKTGYLLFVLSFRYFCTVASDRHFNEHAKYPVLILMTVLVIMSV